MKALFDKVSVATSKLTTRAYSTSFSLGIYCLDKKLHEPIYSIYGFVRFADEIVDTLHDYNKEILLEEFITETYKAIDRGISTNPILNSFQHAVRNYNIETELIDHFLKSMKMDLQKNVHTRHSYEEYILGSAEVVGLMCLRVFTEGNEQRYQQLRPAAMRLGAAFQKVNFLRDVQNDYETLGRNYFPNIDLGNFTERDKVMIEEEIEKDFAAALSGIKSLPASSMFGVYVAYVYYRRLFMKIKSMHHTRIMTSRVRIPNYQKISLLCASYLRHSMNLL